MPMNRIHPSSGKLFHELLIRCLAEQHQPTEDEIELVAGKIWQDSHGSLTGQPWPDVARGSDAHRQMIEAAMMALGTHERSAIPLQ
ncbi:hypothetical protein K3M67_10670 [Sphingobium sp. V4]|uniref:hypothetical protein n=1 Tax=Sphingobium sp. V4 TaxID=3038927 RepID=UPI00255821DA|nr:hypothetical protein [Sphingobium sp. V4]WIW87441.1 hypothetical protein K3M67_10670 [Sphingobium sp. V4]